MTFSRRHLKFIGIAIFLLLIIVGTLAYRYILAPNTSSGIVYIHPGCTMEQWYDSLRIKNLVQNTNSLRMVALLKRYNPDTIRSGRYEIREGMNNNQLINMFRAGLQQPIAFTFNNIRTVEELADIAADHFNFTRDEFLATVKDPEMQARLGFDSTTIIALFRPNTYEMYWDTTPEEFLLRMKREYDRFWTPARQEKARQAQLTPVEVITLASIIEEETIKAEEYPIIAGVYINRLHRGIKLDACPTLKFALGDFTINRILDKHLEVESPYNTYKYAGLPPGPIRITSIQVIDGVLNYQHHDYLYFCAKSDFSGYHNFSRTLRQHNAYAAEYHRELNRRRIWK